MQYWPTPSDEPLLGGPSLDPLPQRPSHGGHFTNDCLTAWLQVAGRSGHRADQAARPTSIVCRSSIRIQMAPHSGTGAPANISPRIERGFLGRIRRHVGQPEVTSNISSSYQVTGELHVYVRPAEAVWDDTCERLRPDLGSLCEYMVHLRYKWVEKSVGRSRVRERGTTAAIAAAH